MVYIHTLSPRITSLCTFSRCRIAGGCDCVVMLAPRLRLPCMCREEAFERAAPRQHLAGDALRVQPDDRERSSGLKSQLCLQSDVALQAKMEFNKQPDFLKRDVNRRSDVFLRVRTAANKHQAHDVRLVYATAGLGRQSTAISRSSPRPPRRA
jgi:hypothetical protein